MKNLFLLFISLVFFISACKQNKPKNLIAVKQQAKVYSLIKRDTVKYTSPDLVAYDNYLQSLDKQDINTSYLAAEKFRKMFASGTADICDTALYIFNRRYQKQADVLDSLHHIRDTTQYDSLLDPKAHLSPKLLAYRDTLTRNGFMLIQEEGDSYVDNDRDFIDKWFYDKINPILKVYLKQINKENKVRSQEDAGIAISAKELVDRLIFWENFNKKQAHFIYEQDAVATEGYYLILLLDGSDNSWLFDDKHQLDSFFKDAASYLSKHYPQSLAASVIPQYYQFITKDDTNNARRVLEPYFKRGVLTTQDQLSFGKQD